MATHLWYESADAVAAQLDTVRDGRGGRGIALWLQAWAGEEEARGVRSFNGETFDVSFEQDFQGLQGGLDIRTGPVAIGITGGSGRSDAAFLATGNPVDLKVDNLGAYVHGDSGPLFFNALAKFDWAELEIAPGAGLGASFDADLFGIQANAGVRLDLGNIFAEPSVGLSWVQSEVEAFSSGPATIGPGTGESLRARAGLRMGAELPLGGGALLPFAAVDAFEELAGRNDLDFTLVNTLRLIDEPPGTRVQAAAGASFVSAGFEAFVRGEIDFSGGTDARSARVGARVRF
jgi:outer membrane autotransporter protein